MHDSQVSNTSYESLSNQQLFAIDALCDRFDEELVSGQSPRIETFLQGADPATRNFLLAELIALELERFDKLGHVVQPEDYLERFPEHNDLVAGVLSSRKKRGSSINETIADPVETVSVPTEDTPNLDNFNLIKEIARGGMGVVWLAEQLHPVKRRVAVKLIKSELTSKEVLARFDAEKQALAMMDHPNIAKVLEAGTTNDDRPFFVMELVDGIPITRYCDKNKLGVKQRLKLFVSVCKAVQHAHQKGILHRDLKPSNVLVTSIDGQAVPKVIDFGLAKAVRQDLKLTEATMMTGFGQVVGTIRYMSPEQAEVKGIKADDIDTRSDVYSLGVLLYELLTGSTPLEKDVLARSALFKVLEIIRKEDPPRPSHRLSSIAHSVNSEVGEQRNTNPSKLRQLLKGDLDWVVMKALEKDRNRRYQTANDLADDVSHYLSGDAIRARPPTTWYQVQKFASRNRGLVSAMAAIAVVLISGIAGTTYGLIRANEKTKLAEEKTKLAEDKSDEADEARGKAVEAGKRATAEAKRARDSEAKATFQLAIARFDAKRAMEARSLLNQVPPEYRDTFEWNYCKRRFEGSDVTCYGHVGGVRDVAFTPDGKRVVSAGHDGTVRLFDATSGQELKQFGGHSSHVLSLAINADGTRFASGGRDKTIILRDTDSGDIIHTLSTHSGTIYGLAFSPSGDRLASASGDKTIKVWDVDSGEEILTITGHEAAVEGVAFHPDGKQLASTGSDDQTVRIWDSQSGEQVTVVRSDRADSRRLAFSPDGTRLATISYGLITLWDTQTWKRIEKIQAHNRVVQCVAFSPDGTRIVSGSDNPTVRISDARTGEEIVTVCGHIS